MGSSSAFTVGLLHALYALKGHMVSKHQLATESVHLEQEVLKETVGSQDQVLAAYGGFNHITFAPNGEISVRPVTLSREGGPAAGTSTLGPQRSRVALGAVEIPPGESTLVLDSPLPPSRVPGDPRPLGVSVFRLHLTPRPVR